MEARVGGTLVDIDLAMVPFGASWTYTLVASLAVLASSSVPAGLIVTVPDSLLAVFPCVSWVALASESLDTVDALPVDTWGVPAVVFVELAAVAGKPGRAVADVGVVVGPGRVPTRTSILARVPVSTGVDVKGTGFAFETSWADAGESVFPVLTNTSVQAGSRGAIVHINLATVSSVT